MHRSINNMWLSSLVSFVLFFFWVDQIEETHHSLILVSLQTIFILFFVGVVKSLKVDGIFLLFVSFFFFGWIASFFASLISEVLVNPNFYTAIKEQYDSKSLMTNTWAWFVISMSYGGAIQALFIYGIDFYCSRIKEG